jgi:hypothetical protein
LLFTLALTACGPKKDLPTLAVDNSAPEEILKSAQDRKVPVGVRGTFGFAAELPGTVIPGVLTGKLVVEQPGHLRLDVLPPVGGQVLIVASNGEHLHVLQPLEHEWWGADDVETVLREATAGAVGIEDFTELLVGQLPQLDGLEPEILGEGTVGPIIRYSGPEGVQVDVELDRAGYLWRTIEARDGEGTVLLRTTSEGVIHNEGAWYPAKMQIALPTLDIVLKLRYRNWSTADDPGDIFFLPVPDGYAEIDMMKVLEEAIEAQGSQESENESETPAESDTPSDTPSDGAEPPTEPQEEASEEAPAE